MNVDGFARLLAGYCLEVQPGQQVAGQLHHAGRAAAARAAARDPRARGLAAAARRAARPGRGLLRAARDAQLDGFAVRRAGRGQETDASLRIQATENANALAGVDPARMARAARARGPLREAALPRRWAITLWPTAGRGPAGRDGHARLRPRSSSARCSWTATIPAAAWGELRAFQAGLIERLAPAREIHIEADGHRPDAERRRPHLGQLRRQAQHAAAARSSPARSRRPPRASIRFTIPTSPRGVVVADVELEFREGRVVDASAERGDDYLRPRSRPTPAPAPGRARHRHELRHRPRRSARSSSTRRSAAPSTSPSAAPIPRPAARNESRRALGPDLRPAPGRPVSADGEIILADGAFT